MDDLAALELILRRIHAKNLNAHEQHGAFLNLDTQVLLRDISDEIKLHLQASKK